ncbi:MAG: hypothetical protein WDN03_11615 [Rhizomicrobium sp.]
MVAVDTSYAAPNEISAQTGHTGWIVLFAFLVAAVLAAGSLVLGAPSGWRAAAEMTARFAVLLFAAAMIAEPVGRLVPVRPMQALACERGSLMLAFVLAMTASLACVAAPALLGGDKLTAQALAYCMLTGAILVVMLFSAHPATKRVLGGPAWRTLQRIGTSYFWLAFALIGIDHMVGPHRPDGWYGLSLLLLTVALLIRFTDSFVAKLRRTAPLAG